MSATPGLPAQTAEMKAALKDFRRIPGVGKKTSVVLWDMGLRSVSGLRGRDPEALYADMEALAGRHVDRCMLYVFRCAVYFAETADPDPQRLKWWNWKD